MSDIEVELNNTAVVSTADIHHDVGGGGDITASDKPPLDIKITSSPSFTSNSNNPTLTNAAIRDKHGTLSH
jgi:hypothetical protein